MIQFLAQCILLAFPVGMVTYIPFYIICEYCIRPRKSLREGLSDWFHESDDDF